MKLVPRPIKDHKFGSHNMFTDLIFGEALQQLESNPGIAFQLCDDSGSPLTMTVSQTNSLSRATPRPFHIQTRAADRSSQRLVWITNDPTYWAARDRKRERV